MATEKAYQNLQDRIAALRQTAAGRLSSDLLQNPQGTVDAGDRRHRRARRHAVRRFNLQSARPDAERCATGSILLSHHGERRQYHCQLRQRPDAHDRAGSGGDVQRTEQVAASER